MSIIFAILLFKIKKKPKNNKDDWFTHKTNTFPSVNLTEIETVDTDQCSTLQVLILYKSSKIFKNF